MSGGEITRSEVIGFSVFVGTVMTLGICWGIVQTWYGRIHGREWPTVSATIDIVSVAFIQDDIQHSKVHADSSYYLATLTYVWHDPELQMGEWSAIGHYNLQRQIAQLRDISRTAARRKLTGQN